MLFKDHKTLNWHFVGNFAVNNYMEGSGSATIK